LREFLHQRDFVEVETPVLQAVASGASARPFATQSNALDDTLYLRVALELYLKRCIIGGIERVYEIGRIFRNEGLSFKHNPEFTMMELYQAYADYTTMMELVEEIVAGAAGELLGATVVPWGTEMIDLAPPWPRFSLRELIIEHTGVDFAAFGTDDELRQAAVRAGLTAEPSWDRAKVVDELMSTFVEPKLIAPTFVVNYPVETTPLAKRVSNNPDEVERFEAYIGGIEIANAFTELNDPLDQRRRFREQAQARVDDGEAAEVDEDFVEALEHGMPPTGGLGLGIDRLVMVLANRQSIRDVILFPQLRARGGA
jgi:lysyl-tRNA synthetase class 2